MPLIAINDKVYDKIQKYEMYSKYTEGKTKELLDEIIVDLQEISNYVSELKEKNKL